MKTNEKQKEKLTDFNNKPKISSFSFEPQKSENKVKESNVIVNYSSWQLGGKLAGQILDINGDYTLTIFGEGAMKDWNSRIGFLPPWFSDFYYSQFSTVVFGNYVTKIGQETFYRCPKITSITIPENISVIGYHAFWDCGEIEFFAVDPNNQYYCNDTQGILYNKNQTHLIQCGSESDINVTIPSTVIVIGDDAFNGCWKMREKVKIPEGVTTIGSNAFLHVAYVPSFTIPSTVTTIAICAFLSCGSLIQISVNSSNNYYSSDSQGILYNKEKTKLIVCGGGSKGSIIVPSTVVIIEDHAFRDCTRLKSVKLPHSVNIIGEYAFRWQTYTTIDISNVTHIRKYAFDVCDFTSITIPPTLSKIEIGVFNCCDQLTSLIIPSSIREIENNAFSGCKGLKSLIIQTNLTKIGQGAFGSCILLTHVKYCGIHDPPNFVTPFSNTPSAGKSPIIWVPTTFNGTSFCNLTVVKCLDYKCDFISKRFSTISPKQGNMYFFQSIFIFFARYLY